MVYHQQQEYYYCGHLLSNPAGAFEYVFAGREDDNDREISKLRGDGANTVNREKVGVMGHLQPKFE